MRKQEPFTDSPEALASYAAYEERRQKEIARYGGKGKNGELIDKRAFEIPKFGKQEVDS